MSSKVAGAIELITEEESNNDKLVRIGTIQNDHEPSEIEIYEQRDTSTNSIKDKMLKSIFYIIIIPLTYIVFFIISYLISWNAYHVIASFATFCGVTYDLCTINTLLFSTKLCHHTVDYQLMRGSSSNYIVYKTNIHDDIPWQSASHMSHVKGSSVQKWHSILIGYGSLAGVCAVIVKLFELNDDNIINPLSTQQMVAIYMGLCGCIGGIILVNIEVYSSPLFSNKYNLMMQIIHLFGAGNYAITGNLAFAVYNNFNWISCLLLSSTIILLIIYRVNRWYQYKKKLFNYNEDREQYEEWVNNMSRINVGIEVTAISISAYTACALLHQLGD